jgi:hypothetical protein
MKWLFILTAISFSLPACVFSVNTPEEKTENSFTKIRNGIQVNARGLQVEQAFLLDEDGALIPDGNRVTVKQKVYLRLIISGWKEKEGYVFPDASQKATTSSGTVILDETNLFRKGDSNAINPQDARYINLSFQLTAVNELFEYVTVEFRVWDETGGGEVSGSYKLYLS